VEVPSLGVHGRQKEENIRQLEGKVEEARRLLGKCHTYVGAEVMKARCEEKDKRIGELGKQVQEARAQLEAFDRQYRSMTRHTTTGHKAGRTENGRHVSSLEVNLRHRTGWKTDEHHCGGAVRCSR
jgi:hypothetical protein